MHEVCEDIEAAPTTCSGAKRKASAATGSGQQVSRKVAGEDDISSDHSDVNLTMDLDTAETKEDDYLSIKAMADADDEVRCL